MRLPVKPGIPDAKFLLELTAATRFTNAPRPW